MKTISKLMNFSFEKVFIYFHVIGFFTLGSFISLARVFGSLFNFERYFINGFATPLLILYTLVVYLILLITYKNSVVFSKKQGRFFISIYIIVCLLNIVLHGSFSPFCQLGLELFNTLFFLILR